MLWTVGWVDFPHNVYKGKNVRNGSLWVGMTDIGFIRGFNGAGVFKKVGYVALETSLSLLKIVKQFTNSNRADRIQGDGFHRNRYLGRHQRRPRNRKFPPTTHTLRFPA